MDLGAEPSASTNFLLFWGRASFRHLLKKMTLPGFRSCRLLHATNCFKNINANDNFANDNFEFAPVARAALA